jgi:hypothetical protein
VVWLGGSEATWPTLSCCLPAADEDWLLASRPERLFQLAAQAPPHLMSSGPADLG